MIIKAKYNGQTVDVPTCWSQEDVDAGMAQFADGIVDIDNMRIVALGHPGNALERRWLRNETMRLLKAQGKL